MVKNIPTKETTDPDYFAGKFYQQFQEEIIPILHKLSQKTEKEELLSNLLPEASIT